ncbi:hypothetical protein JXM83_07010 [Candidatus Woesearchaeota archaeon]|nr:hypothetical protein [Candidatus Woesearchaeota archaeon]
MNIMISLINQGKVKNLIELKKIYHKLVLQKHPDHNESLNSQEEFITLQNCYIDAKQALVLKQNMIKKEVTIETIFDAFYELISLNYPLGVSKNRNTTLRINIISKYYTEKTSNDYVKVENDFTNISKNIDSYESDYNLVKHYLYLLQSYYYNGFKYVEVSIEKERKIIGNILKKRNLIAMNDFINWLYINTMKFKKHPTTAST